MNIITNLFPPKYCIEDVDIFYDGVNRFSKDKHKIFCFTNNDGNFSRPINKINYDYVPEKLLLNKLEYLNPKYDNLLGDKVLVSDIDNVITGPIDSFEDMTSDLTSFNLHSSVLTACFYWISRKKYQHVYEDLQSNWKDCKSLNDSIYLTKFRKETKFFNEKDIAVKVLGSEFKFYEGITKVVIFIGEYKPQILKEPWVKFWKLDN